MERCGWLLEKEILILLHIQVMVLIGLVLKRLLEDQAPIFFSILRMVWLGMEKCGLLLAMEMFIVLLILVTVLVGLVLRELMVQLQLFFQTMVLV
jgi:hypothetical protein